MEATSRYGVTTCPPESVPTESSDELSTDVLMQSLYQDLRCLARTVIHGESPGQTLQPTALVHEVFLRLHRQQNWNSALHFYATAASTMRRILIDQARLKGRSLHRGRVRCEHPELFSLTLSDQVARDLVEFNDALEALQKVDATAAQVAELRVFAGLSLAEVAETLSISPARSFREWTFARAWLKSKYSPPRRSVRDLRIQE